MTKSGKDDRSGETRRPSSGTQGPEPAVTTQETHPSDSGTRTRTITGLDDHHRRMLATAHDRLEKLFLEAVGSRFYGRVAIEVSFENGRPLAIRRQIEGVDK